MMTSLAPDPPILLKDGKDDCGNRSKKAKSRKPPFFNMPVHSRICSSIPFGEKGNMMILVAVYDCFAVKTHHFVVLLVSAKLL